jgi:hypothetical protein
MKSSPTINDLAAALAKAQGAFSAAERGHIAKVQSKKGEGSSYQYAYADLQAYLDVCREPLSANDLAIIQNVGVDGQKVTVTTLITHASGQWLETEPLTLTASDSLPQSIGSAATYCRRYSLSAALGMASEVDDDANGAQGNHAATAPRENNLPMCPECKTNKSVIVGKAEYGGGFVCFAKKGGCGQKWQADGEILLNGAKREQQNRMAPDSPPNSRAPEERPAVKHAQAVGAEHGIPTGEQLAAIPAEWQAKYADARVDVLSAKSRDDVVKLTEGWTQLGMPEVVKAALRPLISKRIRVLADEAAQEPAMV